MHSVLVVDDEPLVRVSLAGMRAWEDDGFSLRFEAANGRDALAQLEAHPEIDMVLLDISMPIMDGTEFLRRLAAGEGGRAESPPVVIILSAFDDFHLVRSAFTLGARDYVLKSEMEGESLLSLLVRTAEGMEESRDRTSTIMERTQVEFLRSQILRDLLAGPVAADHGNVLAGLGLSLRPPFSLCAFWIRDFDGVAARYREDGIERFLSMMERALQQCVAKRGIGEVVVLRPDHAVVFFNGSEEVAQGFSADARENLERYLAVRMVSATREVRDGIQAVPAVYRDLLAGHGVESRIVVLAKRFIREHFAEPGIPLAEIAFAAGVSKNHLSWEFARETGETLTEHLAHVRIDQAKMLLSSTTLKVYEVGELVGYPNVEHFSRVFKKVAGVSPRAWLPENPAANP
jgi:two-component system, response regulator YesN